jgi:hypothetical protein
LWCGIIGIIRKKQHKETEQKKMSKVVDWDGREIDFDTAVALMDDDIREELHEELSPCTAQRFFNAYLEQHYADFGEEFRV